MEIIQYLTFKTFRVKILEIKKKFFACKVLVRVQVRIQVRVHVRVLARVQVMV